MRQLQIVPEKANRVVNLGICLLMMFLAISAFSTVPLHASGIATPADEAFLEMVQKQTFRYFTDCTNPANGLVMDKALNLKDDSLPVDFGYSAATIAGVGFALTAYPVGVERGWLTREHAIELTRTTLKFFLERMTHEHGFFYHFVDMKTGERAMNCEVSSIDTAIFIAGALFAAQYFADPQISSLALTLYSRIDWQWMCNGGKYVSMGWTPEKGFIPASWDHYSEGLLLYILALGAPEHPVPPEAWDFRRLWGRYGEHVYLINPPLFTHQFPQVWLGLKNLRDRHANYFESSVQATLANRQFCLDLRPSFKTFSENRWGLTACIGPFDYQAYGAPPNPAIVDGTVAPAAAACSLFFTFEPSLAALREYYNSTELPDSIKNRLIGRFGLSDSFNVDLDFVASEAFAINQGPLLLMIENARSSFVHNHFMKIPFVIEAMKKAGFKKDDGQSQPLNNEVVYETAAYMPHLRPVCASSETAASFSLNGSDFDDPAWNSARQMLLGKDHIQTIIKPSAAMDFEVHWKMLHNRRSIFFRFDVHDPEHFASHPEEQMYLDDCIEIYLNARSMPFRWNGEHDFQIILSPAAAGDSLRAREFMKGGRLAGALQWKYERTRGGYRAMLEVPRDRFNLADVDKFGISVAAHDIDASGTTDVKYNWFFPLPSMTLAEINLTPNP